MKYFDWNEEKNRELLIQRKVTFEDVLVAIEEGSLLDVLEHPNRKKYPDQRFLVVWLREYVHLVPFVEDEEKIFLKTIIPSRKMHKKYKKAYEN
jgi:uncharacterized DUF497 family protein